MSTEYSGPTIRSEALGHAIAATRPIATQIPAGGQSYFATAALPKASEVIQMAALFEAYLRNGAIQ